MNGPSLLRWVYFLPFAFLLLGVTIFALRYGLARQGITETQIIERYARQYLQEAGTGADLRHCVAIPVDHEEAVLEVICQATNKVRYIYGANATGRLIYRRVSEASET